MAKRVADFVGEIAAASGEQSRGSEHVNKAVSRMDDVTQSTATQTEDLTSTSRALATRAPCPADRTGPILLSRGAHGFRARLAVQERVQRSREAGARERLAQVAVHSGIEAALAVAGEGM